MTEDCFLSKMTWKKDLKGYSGPSSSVRCYMARDRCMFKRKRACVIFFFFLFSNSFYVIFFSEWFFQPRILSSRPRTALKKTLQRKSFPCFVHEYSTRSINLKRSKLKKEQKQHIRPVTSSKGG